MTEPVEPKKTEEVPAVEEPVEAPQADSSAEAVAKAEAPAEPPPATEEPAQEPAAAEAPAEPPVEPPSAEIPTPEAAAEEPPKKKRKKREPRPEEPASEAAPSETPAAETPASDAPVSETASADAPAPEAAPTEAPAAEAPVAEGEAAAEGESPKKKKREPKPEPPDFARRLEAILFATDQPVSARRIADALDSSEGRVKEVIAELRAHYDEDHRAFTVEEIAGGFQVLTRSDFGSVVKSLFEVERDHRLSQASLETLAIVAYKQPIIRAEIEDIRGVQVQPILKTLQEQGLVRIVGRAEQLGRPMLYGTTQKFLMTFGLKSAKDLPPVEELRKKQ